MMDTTLITPQGEIDNPISPTDKEGRLAARAKIEAYEAALAEALGDTRGNMDEVNEEGLTEYFVNGAYVRELIIPAGQTIVSALWNRERLWVLTYGDVSILSEEGKTRIKAPYIGMAPFGSRIALYAHEETQWLAITGAKATTPEEVVEEVVAKDYSELTYPWDKLEHSGET